MKIYLQSALVLLLICSCNEQELSLNIETSDLEAQTIKLSEQVLLRPEKILIYEDLILTAYKGQDNLLRVFDSADGKFKGEYGKVGFGPNDFTDMELRTLQIFQKFIAGIDASSNQVYLSIFEEGSGGTVFNKMHTIQIPLETQFTNDLIILNDSSIIGHSNSDLIEKQLFKYDLKSSRIFEFYDYDYNIFSYDSELSLPSKYELFFKKLISHPKQRAFAVLNTKFNKVTVFDYDLQILNEKNYSGKRYMESLIKNSSFNTPIAYNYNLDVTASERNIFGLYTGMTNSEIKNLSTTDLVEMKSIINVWNWECELVKVLKLDHPISNITYDEKTNSIYALNPYSIDEIYVYSLSGIL